jgi:hypothetical protein
MEMGSKCRQRANGKECKSLFFLYRTVLRLRKIGVIWIRVSSKSCKKRALDLPKIYLVASLLVVERTKVSRADPLKITSSAKKATSG